MALGLFLVVEVQIVDILPYFHLILASYRNQYNIIILMRASFLIIIIIILIWQVLLPYESSSLLRCLDSA